LHFHALLKDGYFHQLCAKFATNQEAVLREMMLTMSHLFGRVYCRQADKEFVQEVVKGSPSVVFLPPMPEQATEILRRHNKSTLDIFTAYVQTFVEENVKQADNALPLTAVKVGTDSSKPLQGVTQKAPLKARSAFVALSGHGDSFESIHELCTTSRSGVFLEEAVVPHVGLYPEDSELPLNAYLYDYFMHSNPNALISANKIKRGDVWFVLNDFSMVLATIVTSLSNFMNLGTDSDLDFIDIRGGGDEADEEKETYPEPPWPRAPARSSRTCPSKSRRKRPRSWTRGTTKTTRKRRKMSKRTGMPMTWTRKRPLGRRARAC
jgi:hypothetical protein